MTLIVLACEMAEEEWNGRCCAGAGAVADLLSSSGSVLVSNNIRVGLPLPSS